MAKSTLQMPNVGFPNNEVKRKYDWNLVMAMAWLLAFLGGVQLNDYRHERFVWTEVTGEITDVVWVQNRLLGYRVQIDYRFTTNTGSTRTGREFLSPRMASGLRSGEALQVYVASGNDGHQTTTFGLAKRKGLISVGFGSAVAVFLIFVVWPAIRLKMFAGTPAA